MCNLFELDYKNNSLVKYTPDRVQSIKRVAPASYDLARSVSGILASARPGRDKFCFAGTNRCWQFCQHPTAVRSRVGSAAAFECGELGRNFTCIVRH